MRGTLDDTGFAIGANEYAIDHVTQREGSSGPLLFSLKSNLSAEEKRTLTLHVCDETALHFADASGPSSRNTYRWNNAGLDWSESEAKTLYLSQGHRSHTRRRRSGRRGRDPRLRRGA